MISINENITNKSKLFRAGINLATRRIDQFNYQKTVISYHQLNNLIY